MSSALYAIDFSVFVFFFNDTATTEIYTLSLHDALPISRTPRRSSGSPTPSRGRPGTSARSEEHTSELQSRRDLVCRLLLEKKKYNSIPFRWSSKQRVASILLRSVPGM